MNVNYSSFKKGRLFIGTCFSRRLHVVQEWFQITSWKILCIRFLQFKNTKMSISKVRMSYLLLIFTKRYLTFFSTFTPAHPHTLFFKKSQHSFYSNFAASRYLWNNLHTRASSHLHPTTKEEAHPTSLIAHQQSSPSSRSDPLSLYFFLFLRLSQNRLGNLTPRKNGIK